MAGSLLVLDQVRYDMAAPPHVSAREKRQERRTRVDTLMGIPAVVLLSVLPGSSLVAGLSLRYAPFLLPSAYQQAMGAQENRAALRELHSILEQLQPPARASFAAHRLLGGETAVPHAAAAPGGDPLALAALLDPDIYTRRLGFPPSLLPPAPPPPSADSRVVEPPAHAPLAAEVPAEGARAPAATEQLSHSAALYLCSRATEASRRCTRSGDSAQRARSASGAESGTDATVALLALPMALPEATRRAASSAAGAADLAGDAAASAAREGAAAYARAIALDDWLLRRELWQRAALFAPGESASSDLARAELQVLCEQRFMARAAAQASTGATDASEAAPAAVSRAALSAWLALSTVVPTLDLLRIASAAFSAPPVQGPRDASE